VASIAATCTWQRAAQALLSATHARTHNLLLLTWHPLLPSWSSWWPAWEAMYRSSVKWLPSMPGEDPQGYTYRVLSHGLGHKSGC
jgi:hypothetical protein